MRASLSTGANREFPGDPQIRCSSYSLAPMAVREARRIVAETAPREDRGSVDWKTVRDLVYWQRVCAKRPQARPLWREQNAAALALADALRAFVEEAI